MRYYWRFLGSKINLVDLTVLDDFTERLYYLCSQQTKRRFTNRMPNKRRLMQTNSLFITKLKERRDKNGNTYLIGSLGMATIMIQPHKTNQDEWNFRLLESKKKEQPQGQGFGGYQSTTFESNDNIPF
jgi:hypothetical protein